MSNEVMQEALAGIEGQVEVKPAKMPEGMTLVGIRLDRAPARAGRFMEAIPRDWIATGMAVAIRQGHVVAANNIFGRWTNGVPKVTATHFVKCACGRRVLMPLAVWEAKDIARRRGIEIRREESGMKVLEAYGACSCGGKWAIDARGEKEELAAFANEVLEAYGAAEKVAAYIPPAAFTVGKTGDVDPQWQWLKEAMANAGKAVAPFAKDDRGDVLIYNPGFWLGYVANHDATNLFWKEEGKAKGRGCPAPSFDPRSVNGL